MLKSIAPEVTPPMLMQQFNSMLIRLCTYVWVLVRQRYHIYLSLLSGAGISGTATGIEKKKKKETRRMPVTHSQPERSEVVQLEQHIPHDLGVAERPCLEWVLNKS